MHFADRLLDACRSKATPICVGLDPVLEKLPAELRADVRSNEAAADALTRFSLGVLHAVSDLVPCVKVQSACFERHHHPGVKAYEQVVAEARAMGYVVIGDAKRGDIGISAAHYAAGCLSDRTLTGEAPGPDALTVNAYFGTDGLTPFIDLAAAEHKGLFALVRTSNPGGDAIQAQRLADGRTVAQCVAQLVAELGNGPACVGESGYSLLGAVVGATKPQDAGELRRLMPRQIFLVPGFGAQGASADDVRACFNSDGQGAIITASRSVIYAYEKDKQGDWRGAVRRAAEQMKADVRAILA